jgi:hypothetical protein
MKGSARHPVVPFNLVTASFEVEERFRGYWHATNVGHSFTASLRSRKAFMNPYLLEEVIGTFGIDDKGSEYEQKRWDPLGLPAQGHHEALDVTQQMEEEDRRGQMLERKPGSLIFGPFVKLESANQSMPPSASLLVSGSDAGQTVPKKSRFKEQ